LTFDFDFDFDPDPDPDPDPELDNCPWDEATKISGKQK